MTHHYVRHHHNHHHERSPLFTHQHISVEQNADADEVPEDDDFDDDEPIAQHQFHAASGGAATVVETMTNLAKTCMGTGCLALPYAAKQGGILLTTVGMLAIAIWNVVASHRLSSCWDLLVAANKQQQDVATTEQPREQQRRLSLIDLSTLPPPPRGTATLGKVAWYALGPTGLFVLDTLTVLLLLGIIIAYNDAIRVFLKGTPLTTHSDVLDAVMVALLIAPLSVVPDMGYLTKTSAAGLTVLAITLLVVAGYGLFHPQEHDVSSTSDSIQWLPQDGLAGASQWFGCCVFGFGVVPLTFNFRESMAEPTKHSQATLAALLLVAIAYIAIALGLLVLYPNIQGDILSELPDHGLVPVVTRLAMVIVVMATAPLLIVPCGEILEGKLVSDHHSPHHNHRRLQILVRFGICFVTVAISVGIPEFVRVLTFVGCFCVAFVSFCVPPYLHLVLTWRQLLASSTGSGQSVGLEWAALVSSHWRLLFVDALLLVWGLAATGISTTYVFGEVISSSRKAAAEQ